MDHDRIELALYNKAEGREDSEQASSELQKYKTHRGVNIKEVERLRNETYLRIQEA